jgi:hypothetical protein
MNEDRAIIQDKYYIEPLAKPQVDTWGYSNSTATGLPQVFLSSPSNSISG